MDPFLLVLLILGLALVTYIISSIAWSLRSFAPWVPSSTYVATKALKRAGAKKGMKFADLGCGDGRIVFLASEEFGMEATGYELSIIPYTVAKLKQIFKRDRNAKILFKNLFDAKLDEFDIIYMYGLPDTINKKLLPKIVEEAKPGSSVISYNFKITNKAPIYEFHDKWRNLYMYRF